MLEQMQSQEDTTQETTSSVVDARTEATEAVATENEVQDVDEQLQKQKETEKIMAKKALQNANPHHHLIHFFFSQYYCSIIDKYTWFVLNKASHCCELSHPILYLPVSS